MSADSSEQEQARFEPSLVLVASKSFEEMPNTEVEAFAEQNFFASSLQSSFQYRILSSEIGISDNSAVPFTF
jgi:beta-N-acetylglucosaminidase